MKGHSTEDEADIARADFNKDKTLKTFLDAQIFMETGSRSKYIISHLNRKSLTSFKI